MKYTFRLYVCGHSATSVRAEANLRQFCHTYLDDDAEFEVIDVLEHPDVLISNHIIVAPTLIVTVPPPTRRFFGDLSDLTLLARELNVHHKRSDNAR